MDDEFNGFHGVDDCTSYVCRHIQELHSPDLVSLQELLRPPVHDALLWTKVHTNATASIHLMAVPHAFANG